MTRRFAHAVHPQVQLGVAPSPLHFPDEGQVNGRPAEAWETELLERAREAARVQETAGLLNGVNPKFNTDNGA